MRFNPEKLEAFMHPEKFPWHKQAKQIPQQCLENLSNPKTMFLMNTLPQECCNASFENYQTETEDQIALKDICQKFAATCIQSKGAEPIGLALTGNPGAGKTHLSVFTAKATSAHGLKVLFVDETKIGDIFQKAGEEIGNSPSREKLMEL